MLPIQSTFGPGPWVHFHGLLKPDADRGELYLLEPDSPDGDGRLHRFACRTSSRARQHPDWFWRSGGPLPPSSQIVSEYSLHLPGYNSAKAQSRFFPLTPNPIIPLQVIWQQLNERPDRAAYFRAIAGSDMPRIYRSDTGLHRDGGPPGSDGCPVSWVNTQWLTILTILDRWHVDLGFDEVNFFCSYFDPATQTTY